jgi:hypothetical protein
VTAPQPTCNLLPGSENVSISPLTVIIPTKRGPRRGWKEGDEHGRFDILFVAEND